MKHSVKQKHHKYLLVILAVILVGVGGIAYKMHKKSETSDSKPSQQTIAKPQFVFDNQELPNWWTAGNRSPSIDQITEGPEMSEQDLPIADMSIHHCKDSQSCSNAGMDVAEDNCFVMLFAGNGSIDPVKAVERKMKENQSFGDMIIEEVGVKTLSINTPEGQKSYQLHQYQYTNKGHGATLKGNALGYVSLDKTHIQIQSVCAEANQLDGTLPVLEAVTLRQP